MACSENEQSCTFNETNGCSKTAYLCCRLKKMKEESRRIIFFKIKKYDNKKEYDETDDDRHL